jgi:hypothetical protein
MDNEAIARDLAKVIAERDRLRMENGNLRLEIHGLWAFVRAADQRNGFPTFDELEQHGTLREYREWAAIQYDAARAALRQYEESPT